MSKIHRSEAIECSNPKCPILTGFTREELESGAPCPTCGTKHSEHVCNKLGSFGDFAPNEWPLAGQQNSEVRSKQSEVFIEPESL